MVFIIFFVLFPILPLYTFCFIIHTFCVQARTFLETCVVHTAPEVSIGRSVVPTVGSEKYQATHPATTQKPTTTNGVCTYHVNSQGTAQS